MRAKLQEALGCRRESKPLLPMTVSTRSNKALPEAHPRLSFVHWNLGSSCSWNGLYLLSGGTWMCSGWETWPHIALPDGRSKSWPHVRPRTRGPRWVWVAGLGLCPLEGGVPGRFTAPGMEETDRWKRVWVWWGSRGHSYVEFLKSFKKAPTILGYSISQVSHRSGMVN